MRRSIRSLELHCNQQATQGFNFPRHKRRSLSFITNVEFLHFLLLLWLIENILILTFQVVASEWGPLAFVIQREWLASVHFLKAIKGRITKCLKYLKDCGRRTRQTWLTNRVVKITPCFLFLHVFPKVVSCASTLHVPAVVGLWNAFLWCFSLFWGCLSSDCVPHSWTPTLSTGQCKRQGGELQKPLSSLSSEAISHLCLPRLRTLGRCGNTPPSTSTSGWSLSGCWATKAID